MKLLMQKNKRKKIFFIENQRIKKSKNDEFRMVQGRVWFVWLLMTIGNVMVKCSEENLEIEVPEKFRPLSAYLIGLQAKRKEQLGFVLNMAKGNNNYKLAQLAFDTVVQVSFFILRSI